MEIVYPRIPHDEKKSVKLKINDIEKIKHLYHIEGWNIPSIASKFKVGNNTIRYHLDPEWRRKVLDRSTECNLKRYKNDLRYKKRLMLTNNELRKQRLLNDEKYKNYIQQLQKAYRLSTFDSIKLKQQTYRSRPDIRKRYQENQKKYYLKNKKNIILRTKENQKKHLLNNPEEYIQRRRQQNKKYRDNNKHILKYKRQIRIRIKQSMRWFG